MYIHEHVYAGKSDTGKPIYYIERAWEVRDDISRLYIVEKLWRVRNQGSTLFVYGGPVSLTVDEISTKRWLKSMLRKENLVEFREDPERPHRIYTFGKRRIKLVKSPHGDIDISLIMGDWQEEFLADETEQSR